MRAEHTIHNQTNGDVSNGYRWCSAFGSQKQLQLEFPRSRNNNFYLFLLVVIKYQEQELKELAFSLYGSGLTAKQVGDIFKEIYGKKYSTTQVSRLFDYARQEVKDWLLRPLESYSGYLY